MNNLISKALLIILPFFMYSQNDLTPGFKAGKPTEMRELSFLEGEWEIELKWTDDYTKPREEWISAGSSKSKFSEYYGATFIQENSLGFPLGKEGHEGFTHWEYNSVFSYDRFQKKYRCVAFDNIMGLTDIYEGNFIQGKLILTNAKTSTYNNQGTGGSNQKNRMTIIPFSRTHFEVIWENIDEEKLNQKNIHQSDWNFVILMIYKKKE